nr:FAD-dependent oxidoreductase [Texas Phoenix palm phytoplasma]
MLKKASNLTLLEGLVYNFIIEDNKVKGVRLENGKIIYSKTVILTTGTYLSSNILIGEKRIISKPNSFFN